MYRFPMGLWLSGIGQLILFIMLVGTIIVVPIGIVWDQIQEFRWRRRCRREWIAARPDDFVKFYHVAHGTQIRDVWWCAIDEGWEMRGGTYRKRDVLRTIARGIPSRYYKR